MAINQGTEVTVWISLQRNTRRKIEKREERERKEGQEKDNARSSKRAEKARAKSPHATNKMDMNRTEDKLPQNWEDE